jgi:hypothetical protein
MVRLFRKDPEKAARQAAAKEEVQRLRGLDRDELAVMILPGLGPEGVNPGSSLRPQELALYLLRDFPGARLLDTIDLLAPLRRSLEKLHAAGLVYPTYHQRSPVWHITDLGERALADGSTGRRVSDAA